MREVGHRMIRSFAVQKQNNKRTHLYRETVYYFMWCAINGRSDSEWMTM